MPTVVQIKHAKILEVPPTVFNNVAYSILLIIIVHMCNSAFILTWSQYTGIMVYWLNSA